MMHNIPDDCAGHPLAPWNQDEWHCPRCGGNEIDVECTDDQCEKENDDEA